MKSLDAAQQLPFVAPHDEFHLFVCNTSKRPPGCHGTTMQFLIPITLGQNSSAPPQELQTGMTKLIDDEIAAGTLIFAGGLAPPSGGCWDALSNHELTVRTAPRAGSPGSAPRHLEHAGRYA